MNFLKLFFHIKQYISCRLYWLCRVNVYVVVYYFHHKCSSDKPVLLLKLQ